GATDPSAPGYLVDHEEADIVARVAVFLAGIAEPYDELQALPSSFSGLSVLPFLMTSGSPGTAPATGAASTAGRSSTAWMHTRCPSIVSVSLTGVHFTPWTMSRMRTPWPIISSE